MSAVTDSPLPEGIRLRTVEVPSGPLALLDADPVGEHVGTVLLVPGFTGSKEDFRLVLAPLAEHGWRAVAVDQRGQYQSPGPDDPEAYRIAALARDLVHLVEALDAGPVHLVGHSFGGLVSREAVLLQPEAFRCLVLMGSGPSALTGPRADVLPFLRPVLLEGGLEAVWEASEAVSASRPRVTEVTAEAKDFLRARFLGSSPTGLLTTADELVSAPDRVEELRDAGLPLLVMYGEHDDAWLPHVQDEMAERLGAPVVVVPGAQHSPAAENPLLTAQVLRDFLRQV